MSVRTLARLGHGLEARAGLALLVGLGTAATGIGVLATSAYLLSEAALRPPILSLMVAIVGVRAFALGRVCFRYLERLVTHDVALRLLVRIRGWFVGRLEPLAPGGLDVFRSGELLQRLAGDVDEVQDLLVRGLAPPAVALGAAALALLLAGALLPAGAVVLGGGLALGGLAVPLLSWRAGRGAGRGRGAAQSDLAANLVDVVEAAPELVAYGRQDAALERLARDGVRLAEEERRAARVVGLGDALGLLASGLTLAGVLVVAIPAVRAGELDGVLLGTLALTVLAVFEVVLPLPAAMERLDAGLAAGRRVVAAAGSTPAVRDPATPRPTPESGTLALQGARLRYRPDAPWALDGVDLRLPPGARVALVGPSGAGKSSVAQVLVRFRGLQEGRATLDGEDLGRFRQDDVRRIVGLVEQDVHLFHGTVRINLALARPDAGPDELADAARRAHVLDWIRSLPAGWETPVGELGARLSGGQRRRLALARAYLAGFPTLIVDEPAAHLDEQTAEGLTAELLGPAGPRSLLLITHRLRQLEGMDEIVLLDRGRVLERGTHADLVRRGGRYARLLELQGMRTYRGRYMAEGS
ncbi:MAG: thiol reductant ABC exporter subunit CydC [bacterium]|nr:thiol reductant ABC exporter subunit CydC [bacterium]